jgi:hypothetical protein
MPAMLCVVRYVPVTHIWPSECAAAYSTCGLSATTTSARPLRSVSTTTFWSGISRIVTGSLPASLQYSTAALSLSTWLTPFWTATR